MFSATNEMIGYFGSDVKRINHALKVYGFAISIAEEEKVSEEMKELICLSAALHDIGIKAAEEKYNSSAGKYQEIEGPPIAKRILENGGVQSDKIDRVCYLIGNHHSYQNIDGLDFQILVEADFLVNIFEDGMDKDSIVSIKNKYFKTSSGISLLERMYL